MPLAGVLVRRGDRGAAPFPADDVTTRFEAVIAEHGPVGVPIDCRSWSQVKTAVGDHTAYSTLRAAERHLIEGGSRVVLSRVVGPTARVATLALRDGSSGTVITWTAEGPGAWYHGLTVTTAVATGTDQVVTVKLNGTTLVTGTVTSAQAAADLITSAGYGTAVIGAGAWATLAAVTDRPLAGGDDDRANIRDAHVAAALAAFTVEEVADDPGTVCASGWTSVATHTALALHASLNNRLARGDMADVSSAATLIAHAAQIRALPQAGDIQLLAGWPTVTIAGVSIPIAPSGFLTGREARTDHENGPGPGQPCAWTFGEFATAESVSNAWSASDREAMLDAGITIIVANHGEIFAEDAITAVDTVRYPQYAEVAGRRVAMAIHAQSRAALRGYVRRTLDGHGRAATAAQGDLVGICSDWYRRDALYGDDPTEAFQARVVTEVLRGRRPRLVGTLVLRPSPSAQTVELTITTVAASDTI